MGSNEVIRYPIHYSPASMADINCDALPSSEELEGMQLACAEQPVPEDRVIGFGEAVIGALAAATVISSLGLFLLGPVVPLYVTLSLSAVYAALNLFPLILRGETSPLLVVLSVAVPPATVLLLHAIAAVLSIRILGAFIFGVLAVTIARSLVQSAFTFYFRLLLTHPRIKPSTIQGRSLPINELNPRVTLYALGILAGTIAAGLLNNTLAIFLAVVGCLTIICITNPLPPPTNTIAAAYRYAIRVLSHYLHYGRNPSGAPGVWYPQASPRDRTLLFSAFLLTSVVALCSATSGFSVWDLPGVGQSFVDNFAEQLRNEERAAVLLALTPAVDWQEYVNAATPPKNHRDDYGYDFDSPYPGQDTEAEPELPPVNSSQKKFLADVLHSSAGLWVVIALLGATQGNLAMLWVLVFSIVIGLTLSVLFPLAILSPAFAACQKFETEELPNLDNDDRSLWQCYVDRLRTSAHTVAAESGETIRESDHLFFGTSAVTDYPVLLHKPIFDEHCYIVGQTGSGKTSLGIAPLLLQLLRGSNGGPGNAGTSIPADDSDSSGTTQPAAAVTDDPESAAPDDASPIVVIDLKGDPALFHTLRAEAAARGQEFRFFTPERGLATHVFNPFSNFQTENRSLLQVCQLILDALGLNHGEGYGRSYFTRQNREALFDALNTDPPPKTFKELNEILKSFRGRPNYPDIYELVSTIHALTQYPQLETIEAVSDPATSIHMPTVLERRQIVYFWLPAAIESITVREVGKLALFSLLSAVIDRQRAGLGTRRTYLFIDEFQRLAGENFRIVLEQARSYGLSCIMANQTQADLNLPTIDLRPTVRTNTRVKMHFGVTDVEELQELSTISGQEIAVLMNWNESQEIRRMTFRGHSTAAKVSVLGASWNESLKQRFVISDILNATDHPRRCILHVTRGSGYSQWGGLPTIVDCFHPISRELYVARSNSPWPTIEAVPGTTSSDVDHSEIERQRNRALVQEQEDTLSRLFDAADAKFRSGDQK